MDPMYAPVFADRSPLRAVEICDVEGRPQAVAWDRSSGRRRVLTHATHGVLACEIEPEGEFVWWFGADAAEEGVWLRQPFAGGPSEAALIGVPRGRMYGVALDATGDRAAVCTGVGTQARCYVGRPGGLGRLVAAADGHVVLIDMSPDGQFIVLAGRPDGVVAAAIIPTAGGDQHILAADGGGRLWALGFRPGAVSAAPELLMVVESGGRFTVGAWRETTGLVPDERLTFDSEITAAWYGAGRQAVVQQDHAGRSRLFLVDLDDGARRPVNTPPGTILDWACAPEGALHCLWTRESEPPRRLVATAGPSVAETPSPRAGTAAPDIVVGPQRREIWTAQSYGRIHSFLATPPGRGPWPTMFLVHGGPFLHDRDSYDPRVEQFTGAGYAVVRTNYRGSTGYGTQWRSNFGHRVGFAQVEDLCAVRRQLIELGVAHPQRIGLCGYSWGGYVVLFAMGTRPDDWAVGLAVSPVADYVAAYRGTTPALQEVDEELFGGDPDHVPDRYLAANPMTYAHRVRGPLLIAAATADERCPADQVERYAAVLRRRSVPHRLMWTEGGHHGDATSHTTTFAAILRYADAALRGPIAGPASPSSDGRTVLPSDLEPIRERR